LLRLGYCCLGCTRRTQRTQSKHFHTNSRNELLTHFRLSAIIVVSSTNVIASSQHWQKVCTEPISALSTIDERFTITSSLLGFAQGSGLGVFGVKDGAKYHTFLVAGCYRFVLGIWSYREHGRSESSMICTISENYLIEVLMRRFIN
jgi:hypothetical protein